MLRWAPLLLALLLPVGRSVAAGDPSVAERLADIRSTVLDRGVMFSVQAVLDELDRIEPLTAPDSAERGRVMQLRSFVENKGGRTADSIRHGEEALRIEAIHPFLDLADTVSLQYALARQAERGGHCDAAVPHYRAVLPLLARRGVGEDGQLGTWQRLAYCLHETGQFAEARQINQAILARAAALFPPTDPRTFTARLNLAQNDYELGDVAAARTVLEGLLTDSVAAKDGEMTDKALFQLGVLAFEGGRRDEALSLMERRLSLARASGDADRVAAAQEALDVLRAKLSGAATP